jgi:hypothetical protein
MSTDTSTDDSRLPLTEPIADHAVDALCAIAIAATAAVGAATDATTAGLVAIALGKRLMQNR